MNNKILIFVLTAMISSTAGAETLFSNFGPSLTYNQFPGIGIAGSDETPLGRSSLAASFSPSITASLDSIDLALGWDIGAPTFTIEIADDLEGAPDNILETFNVETVGLGDLPYLTAIESVTSTTHPVISSGATYWVVVLPGDPSTDGAWWSTNNLITVGGWDFSRDNGATWEIEDTGPTPVFDVNGTAAAVPEPSSALLLFGGGMTLVFWRRRSNLISRIHAARDTHDSSRRVRC